MKIVLLNVLMVVFCIPTIWGQNIHGENDLWFFQFTKFEITDNLRMKNEVHFRYDDWWRQKEQLIIRPSVEYDFLDKISGGVGYSYVKTYPYGDYPLEEALPEHNIWEELILKFNSNQFKFYSRNRIEHRFRGQVLKPGSDSRTFIFVNRVRLRLGCSFSLNQKWSLDGFAEVWNNLSDNFRMLNFDRRWLYAGGTINFNSHMSIGLGFLDQWVRNETNLYEHHPTIQSTLKLNLKK